MSYQTIRTDSPEESCDPRIRIVLSRENDEKTPIVYPDDTVLDLLLRMKIHPDGVLVFSGSEPIPLDDTVEGLDELKIINVASGG
jgi:sulfur carrier protein ThiS